MKNKTTCFLPCRKGSERVPRKNIKPFAGHEFGLIQVKLRQLSEAKKIDEIMLSTNDDDIINYASSLNLPNLIIHKRNDGLSSSSTSTDTLVSHALELIPQGDILWTHVTSPFITAKHYDEIISCYTKRKQEGYDSLMTVNEIFSFLWQHEKPMNYDRKTEKWPRTQSLPPVYEVNSGAFLASTAIYKELQDRIGTHPYLYTLNKLVSHDIDWPEDFTIAECMAEKGLVAL